MNRPANYHTKQRKAILSYIASLQGAHVTAAQIIAHFATADTPIGRTTVYRQLEKLRECGSIRKYTLGSTPGACFQYVNQDKNCHAHLHLKCEGCGKLLHLQCDMLKDIQRHFFDEHAFQIDALRTVLYGKCENCMQNI